MAKMVLTQDEQKIQQAFLEEKYDIVQNILAKSESQIRPSYRAIFEASFAFVQGDVERAWEVIAEGLQWDGRNYELYMLLGEYYASRNLRQAYLCYENALFYCNDPDDCTQIFQMIEQIREEGVFVPKAAIVILSYNLLDMTKECIDSIRDTTPDSAREIIVVDNASTDGSVAWLKQQTDIKLLCNRENKGFPAGCNQGIELAEKESDIFLLNNDTVMTDNALFWLRMGLYESEEVGSTGSVSNHVANLQMVIEDGKSRIDYLNFAKQVNLPVRKPYLNKMHLVGFALLLRRKVLDQIGLLDERFSPGNWEDNDICLRINLAGYRNVLCKNSFIIHWGSKSFIKDRSKYADVLKINEKKFFEKWSAIHLDESAYLNSRLELVPLIKEKCNASAAIMVVGAECGGFMSCLQGNLPDAQIFGLESRMYLAQIANRIADTVYAEIEGWKGDELKEAFDIIVINDILEHVKKPSAVLTEITKMLKKGGCLLLSFVNSNYFLKLLRLEDRSNTISRGQADKMLSSAGFCKTKWLFIKPNAYAPETRKVIEDLQRCHPEINEEDLMAYRWTAVVEKRKVSV